MRVKLTNEIKIGLVVISAILVTYFGFRLMRDVPLVGLSSQVEVVYDRVDGLSAGSIVYLKGVKIGSVKSLELLPSDSILVVLTLDNDRQIPVGSIARISSASLIDGKAVTIEKSDSIEMVPNNGRIKGIYELGFFEDISSQSEGLSSNVTLTADQLSQLTSRLNEMLNEENRDNVARSLEGIGSTTQTLAEVLEGKRDEIESLIEDASKTMAQLEELSSAGGPKVDSLLTTLEATIADLRTSSDELEASLQQLSEILTKINEGQGSLGLLVNDPQLYHNLDSLSTELTELTRSINENPRRILRHLKLFSIF
jgi:ABC-type transporter Mla subunit MlaD